MRLIFLFLFLILGILACTFVRPQQASDTIVDPSQLLVLTTDRPAKVADAARHLGHEVTQEDRLGALSETLIHLRIPANRTILEAIAEIEITMLGVTAGANHAYQLQVSWAPAPGSGFANALIGWPKGGC